MQNKLTVPLILLSVVAAVGLTARWISERQQTHSLVIATGGQQGEYYAFAAALAEVVMRHEPRIRITVKESAGSLENLNLIENGQAQLAIVQSDTPPKPSVRAVAYLFPEVFHLIALPESGIQSVDDLRGKRVALMPQGSGSYKLFTELRTHYELAEGDFTALPMPPDQAYAALQQKQVDALFRVIAIGNTATADLLRTTRARLIPIDQGDSLRLFFPYLEKAVIPKGTYDGALPLPSEDVSVVGVRAVLVANQQVNEDVIRLVTQTLFEFRSELVQIYPRAALIRLPDAGENLGLPLHPGAKTYYAQNEPGFLERNADSLALLLSLGALLASALWQSHLWLMRNQKNRADLYNQQILNLTEQAQKAKAAAELQTICDELFLIFRTVVEDLDCDRITSESFQSFTFTWEMAIATIRHREVMLNSLNSSLVAPPIPLPLKDSKESRVD